jgi:mannosyltransferase
VSGRIVGSLQTPAGWALLAVTAVAAALRFATLDQQSYWYDEAVTATLLDGSLIDVVRGVVETESTPPLYYLLGWGWVQVLGSDEWQLRSLSALLGTLVVPVAFFAGRIVATVRIGLAAAALAAVSPVLVWYSQEARAYALLALLGGLSFVLFALARSDPSARRLAFWAIVGALALATHYFAVFLIVAESALLLLAHPRSTCVRKALAAVAVAAVALFALAATQTTRDSEIGWIGQIDLTSRLTEAAQRLVAAAPPSTWAGATGASVTPDVWLVAAAVLVLSGALLATLGSTRERAGALLALAVASFAIVAPIAVALLADAVARGKGDVFFDRNVLGAWVPLAVFVAGGLAARRAGLLGAAVLAALVCWSIAVNVDVATSPELQRDDWRAVAELTEGPRTAVVVYPYFQGEALTRQRPELVPQTSSESLDRVVLVLAGLSEPPSSFRPPPGFAPSGTDRFQQFTLLEYKADEVARLAPSQLLGGESPIEADLRILIER